MSRHQERQVLTFFVVAIAAVVGIVALVGGGGSGTTASGPATSAPVVTEAPVATAAPADPAAADTSTDATAGVVDAAATEPGADSDLDGEELSADDTCLMTEFSLRQGQSGDSVVCLQEALIAAGFLEGTASGSFDYATFVAVEEMQTDRNLFVDGVVGRESALSLGIWPDEESFVVRTPPPAPGSMDSMGFPLSSVSSTGKNAPPLPENSGSGRRVVYERAGQRVWAVDDDGSIIRSWLVSGSQYANEMPGTHTVYSRSDVSTAWNGKAWLPKMIRYQQTRIGHIGFHAIPLKVSDNSPYQTEAELGTRLSGGCQRQANADADFLWEFAQVGTTVVVI
jgi:peptidoglycan hydrolase-like protein with peptidoglycan-binding domain